ncbi:WhiB family transcriptional regulator [Dietzia cinnamea]|uniref:WhiB family transcriptional regulator n=1 Tax=Dietzia cinnamea TaxID=321318 RepID=UPI0021A7A53F|nr:WhiB family transcriptional regulator [Dietzia cinnamea]MCT2140469.1 WhiB family transcriptional regulator [Dietzia cinnamea]
MSAAASTYPASAPWPGDWAARAACVGHQPLHDDEIHGEDDEEREARYHRAAGVCRRCVVFAECAAWRESTPVAHRVGVSAGRVRRPSQKGETDLLAPVSTAVAVA